VQWKCLVGNASAWPAGLVLEKNLAEGYVLRASKLEKENDHYVIAFEWTNRQASFRAILQEAGLMPLPPYIKRKPETGDEDWYQTVYADKPGSVAAPTAGLHFTSEMLQRLKSHDIEICHVTLHV